MFNVNKSKKEMVNRLIESDTDLYRGEARHGKPTLLDGAGTVKPLHTFRPVPRLAFLKELKVCKRCYLMLWV